MDQTQAVETDETIFYVQGGGQPCDTGAMKSNPAGEKERIFDVEAVRYGLEGKVLHFGHFSAGSTPFDEGETVEQRIDSDKRDLHSRIHSGGHLVSLAIRHLATTSNQELDVSELKAQHYPGASFVEFKGTIAGDYKEAIQSQATKYVKDALPVKLSWHKPEDLKANGVITIDGVPVVSGNDGNVRVVDIVGAGAYPCGGTHVPDSSFVGNLVVKNIKRQKGISKISYAIED